METLTQFLNAAFWSTLGGTVLLIIIYFTLAYVVHRLAHILTARISSLTQISAQKRIELRAERIETLERLIASLISFLAFTAAGLFSMAIFLDAANIIWIIGLFAAAFGLGARPLVSDFLTGVGFLFEDPFDVGEKVEFLGAAGVQGVVQHLNLRSTVLRAYTGELYTVPNGEIRTIRNFSRGSHSEADVELRIASKDLSETLVLLEELGQTAPSMLPNLLEPWRVLSEDGYMGPTVELKLAARARFGQAAALRPRILALVQQALEDAGLTPEA